LFFVFFFTQKEYVSYGVAVFLVLWFIHYFNRSVIFPLRIKTTGKKMPVVIMLSAIFFNTVNTGIIASYLANNSEQYGLEWFTTWQFILGIGLFLIGFFINQYSDYLLINLRKPGETNYKIPNGFLFRFISCPNLFGEVIEWLGFAIMTWCLPSWAFFIWTFANLVPRAISHHKWYLQKFPNYPKSRKAIFPFVW
jgi:3-oxo-5-alpha-steroid 4-dehydrogenase 1